MLTLFIDRNPFIEHAKRAEPRAVPATSANAMQTLDRAVLLLGSEFQSGAMTEVDFRRASARQRALFNRLGFDPALFFVGATSMELDVVRKGKKWTASVGRALEEALHLEPSSLTVDDRSLPSQ